MKATRISIRTLTALSGLFIAVFGATLTPGGSSAAFGLGLDEAKKGGLVGETPNGYLEPVKPSPEVGNLVKDINQKRKAAYEGIARKNGTGVDVVEQIGGKEAITKSARGTYVKAPSGEWHRK